MTRRVRNLIAPLLAVTAFGLALPAFAAADPDAVVRDCAQDGFVDGNYSDEDKRKALRRIPADLDEYSDCRAVIGASIGDGPSAGVSGADGSGGGAGADSDGDGVPDASGEASLGPAERREAARERELARAETESLLGDRSFDPQNAGAFEQADTSSGLPLPVLLALIALALLSAAGAFVALRRRNPAFMKMLRRDPQARGRS